MRLAARVAMTYWRVGAATTSSMAAPAMMCCAVVRGDDELNGGHRNDRYAFASGDGRDLLNDDDGGHYFDFDGSVAPESVVLYHTDTTDSRFRLEYGQGDTITSIGATSPYWVGGVAVGGTDIPLVQRSDLVDGRFYSTRWNDVFRTWRR